MVTLSFTIFSGQKNYNRAHMLFQVLCGFEPIFYTTHPNEEPNKSGIFILPGVELSVKEGASSVHMLVVFSPTEWISNGVDHISRMVGSMFLGIDDPGNENTCTENDMLTVIHELDKQNKDYFIVCAHVEQKKGFWEECGGSLIEKLSSDVAFKRRVLGFQKVRTRDKIKKVHDWMGYDIVINVDDIEKEYLYAGDCCSTDEFVCVGNILNFIEEIVKNGGDPYWTINENQYRDFSKK